MNLGDPELELIDPTPNVHSLFIHFDTMFFWAKLANRAVVRWSKRMYSSAGVCSYEGRGGLCDIALSEPLLKLRPRKDLIETLLHEMIHAFLFVSNRDQDRDGHGPNFKAHMHRINRSAGLNISVYHNFIDEVNLYQTHWWRCNGPCQTRRPHFGIVRRPMNKAPGPTDYWWNDHNKRCGGTFSKIKEPEKLQKSKGKKTNTTAKPTADITKYITNNKTINNVPNSNNPIKPVLKDSSNVIVKANTKTKTNNSSTLVVSKKEVVFNPTAPTPPSKPTPIFTGTGHTLNTGKRRSNSVDVTATVRNIWATKQIPTIVNKAPVKMVDNSPFVRKPSLEKSIFKEVGAFNPNKHKAEPTLECPPTKMKKIDDYFNATSVLKDLYGDDYNLTKSNNNTKLVAVNVKVELVDCPICHVKFSNEEINRHLDECLNKDIIEKLSKDSVESIQDISQTSRTDSDRAKLKEVIGVIPPISPFRGKPDSTNNNVVDLINFNVNTSYINTDKGKRKIVSQGSLQSVDIDKVSSLVEEIDEDRTRNSTKTSNNTDKPRDRRRNTISFITRDRGDYMPSEKKEDNEISEGATITPVPGPSTEQVFGQMCPCCGKKFDKPVEEHLDECLVFFDSNTTIPDEGASTSYVNNTTIVIDDDDDIFDESLTLNATGTKTPCPCCMKMVEQVDMNDHLDLCLQ